MLPIITTSASPAVISAIEEAYWPIPQEIAGLEEDRAHQGAGDDQQDEHRQQAHVSQEGQGSALGG